MIKIGDTVYYNDFDYKQNKLKIRKAIAKNVVTHEDGSVLVCINCMRDNCNAKQGSECNKVFGELPITKGFIGSTFFESEEEVRKYFGKKELRSHNRDCINKFNLYLALKNKFPEFDEDDVFNFITTLEPYDTFLHSKIIDGKCDYCGAEINEESNYCKNCGARFE